MHRQGPLGGQSQQGRPNYQGTYPTYFNNPVYHNPMQQQQQQGFRRNIDSGCDLSVDGENEQDELACGRDTEFRQDEHPYLD